MIAMLSDNMLAVTDANIEYHSCKYHTQSYRVDTDGCNLTFSVNILKTVCKYNAL